MKGSKGEDVPQNQGQPKPTQHEIQPFESSASKSDWKDWGTRKTDCVFMWRIKRIWFCKGLFEVDNKREKPRDALLQFSPVVQEDVL